MNGISVMQYNPMSAAPHDRLVEVAEVTSQFDFVRLTGTGARRYGRDEIVWRRAGRRWTLKAGWARAAGSNRSCCSILLGPRIPKRSITHTCFPIVAMDLNSASGQQRLSGSEDWTP
eukprot:4845941-Pyramimonas_sp.AAC.1